MKENSFLHEAAKKDYVDELLLKALIDGGICIDILDSVRQKLLKSHFIKFLLFADFQYKESPLFDAIRQEKLDNVIKLIKLGADLTLINKVGSFYYFFFVFRYFF